MARARGDDNSGRKVRAAIAVALGCVIALHVVRPEVSPVSRRLSEYANGPHGWLMLLAFVGVAAAVLVLAVRVRRHRAPRATVVAALLAGAGAGMLVAAVFKTDPAGAATRAELIHSAASGAATLAIVTAAALWSVLPFAAPGRLPRDGPAAVLAVAAIALAALSRLLHHTPWTGAGQRALWVIVLAWLLRSARNSRRGRRQ